MTYLLKGVRLQKSASQTSSKTRFAYCWHVSLSLHASSVERSVVTDKHTDYCMLAAHMRTKT